MPYRTIQFYKADLKGRASGLVLCAVILLSPYLARELRGQPAGGTEKKTESAPDGFIPMEDQEAADRTTSDDTANESDGPRPGNSNGFSGSRGRIILAATGGATLAEGAYIRHERRYADILRAREAMDDIDVEFYNQFEVPSSARTLEVMPGESAQLDIEYMIRDYLGLGITGLYFEVKGRGQDVLPGYRLDTATLKYERQDYIEPFPREFSLYKGTSALFQAVLHLPGGVGQRFDPYLALRAGGTAFTGTAHDDFYHDPINETSNVSNGRGLVGGAALGLNISLAESAGFRVEGAYYRHFLRSQLFDQRALTSYHVLGGFYIRYNP